MSQPERNSPHAGGAYRAPTSAVVGKVEDLTAGPSQDWKDSMQPSGFQQRKPFHDDTIKEDDL